MTDQTVITTDPLTLQAGLHPERLYLATMQNASPQFSVDRLLEHVQTELVYWTGLLASPTGSAFLLTFEKVEHAIEALKQESIALKDILKAVEAHGIGAWADASNYYTRSVSDLQFAASSWCSALARISDETPFDHFRGTRAEREKYKRPEPPRQSLPEMQAISPMLFRIYQNIDRVFCLGVEIAQRQMLCLARYMTEAETSAYSPQAIAEAINELLSRWGYREITQLVEDYYRSIDPEKEPEYYLCVLQTPEGGPAYCRSARRLLKEVEKARAAGTEYAQCPAPRPEDHMWMVVGNFSEAEEDEVRDEPDQGESEP